MRKLLTVFSILLFSCAVHAIPIAESLPSSISIRCGKLSVRLDKIKRWNMNRVEYNRTLMGIDSPGAHYGTVFYYAGEKGFIGSGHVETGKAEQIQGFEIISDGRKVAYNDMNKIIIGKIIQINRISKLRDFNLRHTLWLKDDTIEEIVRVTADKDVSLQSSYHFMHPWSPRFDVVMGINEQDKTYIRRFTGDGKFIIRENLPAVAWYDCDSGYGIVTVRLNGKNQCNPTRYVWDRKIYRKDYFVDYSNQIFTSQMEAVYHIKTAFFYEKTHEKWEKSAWKLVEKLRNKKQRSNVVFLDVLKDDRMEISGFPWRVSLGPLYRLPATLNSSNIGQGIMALANHTAGGTVRFRTDSPYIELQALLKNWHDFPTMPRSGSAGFDWYTEIAGKEHFCGNIAPTYAAASGQQFVEACLETNCKPGQMQSFTLHLPRMAGIKSLKLGFAPESELLPPLPHKISLPVIFYGFHLTQGSSASRPATAYSTLLCRKVDAPEVNLGFCGSCKGEIVMAEIIASLKAAALIIDYDYNAPQADFLRKTHEPFLKKIREKQPDLPVIILTRCTQIDSTRRDIIYQTYANALKDGDKNIYFIDGGKILETLRENADVDGCHPNDLGFYEIYKCILPTLQKILRVYQKQ